MPSVAVSPSYKNRVLASLPPAEIERLAPHLSPVTLKVNRTLHDPSQMVDTVYFPEEGICSTVVAMETGNTIEVGVTGRDGFVGLPALLGTSHSPNRSFIQIPEHGFSVKAKVLRELAEASSELRLRLQRVVQRNATSPKACFIDAAIRFASFLNQWLMG